MVNQTTLLRHTSKVFELQDLTKLYQLHLPSNEHSVSFLYRYYVPTD